MKPLNSTRWTATLASLELALTNYVGREERIVTVELRSIQSSSQGNYGTFTIAIAASGQGLRDEFTKTSRNKISSH